MSFSNLFSRNEFELFEFLKSAVLQNAETWVGVGGSVHLIH